MRNREKEGRMAEKGAVRKRRVGEGRGGRRRRQEGAET